MKPNCVAIRKSKEAMFRKFIEVKRKAELEGKVVIKNLYFFFIKSVSDSIVVSIFKFIFRASEEGVSNVLSDLNTVPTPTFSITPIGLELTP